MPHLGEASKPKIHLHDFPFCNVITFLHFETVHGTFQLFWHINHLFSLFSIVTFLFSIFVKIQYVDIYLVMNCSKQVAVPPCREGLADLQSYYQPLESCIAGTSSKRWVSIQNRSSSSQISPAELEIYGKYCSYEIFYSHYKLSCVEWFHLLDSSQLLIRACFCRSSAG